VVDLWHLWEFWEDSEWVKEISSTVVLWGVVLWLVVVSWEEGWNVEVHWSKDTGHVVFEVFDFTLDFINHFFSKHSRLWESFLPLLSLGKMGSFLDGMDLVYEWVLGKVNSLSVVGLRPSEIKSHED